MGMAFSTLNGVNSVQGTLNQIRVNGGLSPVTGDIVLGLYQDLNTTSTPTFAGITTTGNSTLSGATAMDSASINSTLTVGGIASLATLRCTGAIKVKYTAVTATYTVLVTDYLVDCTSGTFTVTLPSAVGLQGQRFEIKNSGAGTITLAADGAETIDGVPSKTLLQNFSYTLTSNNSNWIIT